MRIEKKGKKSEIRNPQSEIIGPMLFARRALAPGPGNALNCKGCPARDGRRMKGARKRLKNLTMSLPVSIIRKPESGLHFQEGTCMESGADLEKRAYDLMAGGLN
jgi:hypothetical protein